MGTREKPFEYLEDPEVLKSFRVFCIYNDGFVDWNNLGRTKDFYV